MSLKNFIRKPSQLLDDEELNFMVFNWQEGDFEDYYHIYAFGVTEDGRSVCLDIEGFVPYFYVKVPFDWTQHDVNELKYKVEKSLYSNKKHLVSAKLVQRKDINGFNNDKQFKFVRFVFDNAEVCRKSQWIFKKTIEGYENIKFCLYDVKTGPLLTFCHIQDILMSGWIKIKSKDLEEAEDISRCQLCYKTKWKKVKPLDKNDLPPLVTLSFDIECYSYNGDFPDPAIPENTITQIGSGFIKQNSEDVLKHVIVLGECDPIENVIIEIADSEEDLIEKWVELIEKTDPDLIIGYNIDAFDWHYIWERAEMLDMTEVIARMSRINLIHSVYKDNTLESNAYGMNYFKYIDTPGINQLDLLHWFRKNKKLESYKLDDVSELYLKNKKHPVTPKQIFAMSGPNGNSKERSIVADYCAQDTFLPVKLMNMFNMVVNLIEMSKVTRVPFMYLILRGETIKVHSQIAYEARKQNYLIPVAPKKGDSSFSGATVLSPKIGCYKVPISGLDFASLYPSIMIAWNLCPTTFVKNSKYDNLEGIEYKHFQWDGGNYKFVQNKQGLVPGILSSLWAERKKVKKEMGNAYAKSKSLKEEAETEENPEKRKKLLDESKEWKIKGDVLNGKQLAVKVSMNSIYGAFGATTFSVPCKPISATVTYTGRCMIEHSKNCAQNWYDGSYKLKTIKSEDEEIQTETGNKKIKDLIENEDKLQTPSGHWKTLKTKKYVRLFKVRTNKGTFIVTEDNELVKKNKIL